MCAVNLSLLIAGLTGVPKVLWGIKKIGPNRVNEDKEKDTLLNF